METVVFDFDGVIHSYTSPWQGVDVISDPPVEGIAQGMKILKQMGYRIIIVSARCREAAGVQAVTKYLDKHKIPYDSVDTGKPPAVAYVDDRAVRFTGEVGQMIKDIQCMQVWNRPKHTCYNCNYSTYLKFPMMQCTKHDILCDRNRVACDDFTPTDVGTDKLINLTK